MSIVQKLFDGFVSAALLVYLRRVNQSKILQEKENYLESRESRDAEIIYLLILGI